jgi:RNA binding exosome subunit
LFVGRIEARAYSRATELKERVITAVRNTLPLHVRDEMPLTVKRTEGQSGDSIFVVEATIEKRKPCEEVFRYIINKLSSADRSALVSTLEQRLDEQCTLFLRIDKQASFLGRLELPHGPDVISIRIHIRDYPRCVREEALKTIQGWLLSAEEKE